MPRLRRQFLLLVPLLACAAVAGRAADQEPRPANDTISATRRDLEALKTDRNLPSGSAKVALPSIDAPQIEAPLPLGPGAPLAPNAPPAPGSAQPRRSSSWLIDAMEGNAGENGLNGGTRKPNSLQQLLLDDSSRDGRARNGGEARSRLGTADLERGGLSSARGDLRRGADADADKPDAASLKEAAPNPLAGYMAGWMTSRDFNLLLKPETGGTPGASAGSGPAAQGPGETFSFSPSSVFSPAVVGISTDTGPARMGGPAGAPENPYLQVLTLPAPPPAAPPTVAFPPSPAPMPFPSVLPPAGNPAPAERVELSRPELQKRDDDAKYFPQLKRF